MGGGIPPVPQAYVTPWIEKWLLVLLICNLVLGAVFVLYGSTAARDSLQILCEITKNDPRYGQTYRAYCT